MEKYKIKMDMNGAGGPNEFGHQGMYPSHFTNVIPPQVLYEDSVGVRVPLAMSRMGSLTPPPNAGQMTAIDIQQERKSISALSRLSQMPNHGSLGIMNHINRAGVPSSHENLIRHVLPLAATELIELELRHAGSLRRTLPKKSSTRSAARRARTKRRRIKKIRMEAEREVSEKMASTTKFPGKEVTEMTLPTKEVTEKETPAKEVPEKEVPTKDVTEKEVPPKEVTEKEVTPKEVMEKEVPTKEVMEKEVPTKEVMEKEVPPKEVTEKEVPIKEVTEKEVPIKEVPEKEVPTKDVTEKEVPPKEVTEKEVPIKEVPEKEVPTKDVPEKTTPAKDVPKKKAPAKEVTDKKASAKKVPTKKAAAKKAPTKKSAAKKASTKKAAAKKASTKKVSSKKAATKKVSGKKATTKKVSAKKATTKKLSVKKAAAKKVSSKKAAAKKQSGKKATAKYKQPKSANEPPRLERNADGHTSLSSEMPKQGVKRKKNEVNESSLINPILTMIPKSSASTNISAMREPEKELSTESSKNFKDNVTIGGVNDLSGSDGDETSDYEQFKRKKPKIVRKVTRIVYNRKCANCGVNYSPQWRKGPSDTKLCNSCGLYFNKNRNLRDHVPRAIKFGPQKRTRESLTKIVYKLPIRKPPEAESSESELSNSSEDSDSHPEKQLFAQERQSPTLRATKLTAEGKLRKNISVGKEYQAVVPPLLKSRERFRNRLLDRRKGGKLIWSPSSVSKDLPPDIASTLSDIFGEDFIDSSNLGPSQMLDRELNVTKSLDSSSYLVSTYRTEDWSWRDQSLFIYGYRIGKEFERVREVVQTKSMGDVMSFYYDNKPYLEAKFQNPPFEFETSRSPGEITRPSSPPIL